MNTGCTLLVTAVLGAAASMSPAALAESCSGGSDRGMDATGNECGTATQTAAQIDPSLWTVIVARLTPRAEHADAMDHTPLAGAVSKVPAPESDAPDSVLRASFEQPAP